MPGKVHEYRGKDIVVRYDISRCIHAAECIAHLGAVFDRNRRPWILPDLAPAADVAQTILQCPSGALHFTLVSGDLQERLPAANTITAIADGALYVRGNVTLKTADGSVLLQDTRVALCRCGASKNKPFCDDSHIACEFCARGADPDQLMLPAPAAGQVAPSLVIITERNGPYHVQGDCQVADDVRIEQVADTQLCRCGGSKNKPYCDGTHQLITFVAD